MNHPSSNVRPPRWADRLLERFCAPHLLEEVEGDLHERFQRNAALFGERSARRQYTWEVLGFVTKPFAIKRQQSEYSQPFLSTGMIQNYVKTSMRGLKRNWNYTAINVVGLTLGLACCLLLFLAIRYELSYDRHHTNADRIYRLVSYKNKEKTGPAESSTPLPSIVALRNDFPELKNQVTMTFLTEGLVKVQPGRAGQAPKKFEEAFGAMAFIEPEYFRLFDYNWISGNSATSLNSPGTVVLTQRIAQKYFGNDNPIGRTIRLNNKMDFTVTGVVQDSPTTTSLPFEVMLSWASLKQYGPGVLWDDWASLTSAIETFMMLPQGTAPEQIEQRLVGFTNKYYRPEHERKHLKLQPLTDIHFDTKTENYARRAVSKPMIWSMALIGLFILFTACINFINLATAQAIRRAKEVGVRKVLGSTKGQLVRQFLGETGLMTTFAVVLSLLVAFLALPSVAELLTIKLDGSAVFAPEVLTFLLVLAGLTTVLAGFYPALVLSRYQPVEALKAKICSAGRGQMNLRRSLIVLQFAISQTLIIGTIVAYNQVTFVRSADLGYNKEAIITIPIPDRKPEDINALRARLAGLPAISSMSFGISAPSSENNWDTGFRLEGADKEADFSVYMRPADTAYVRTYGLQLVAGRVYQSADTIREYVVNESFVKQLGYQDPRQIIGKRMALVGNQELKPIVGVVKDFNLFPSHKRTKPCVLTTLFWAYNKLGIKLAPGQSTESISRVMAEVERTWTSRFPDYIFKYDFLDRTLNDFYKNEERIYWLFQLLAGIAIFIGCLGLYGVVTFMVESRTKEVGIRKTLGATTTDIFGIFSLDFLKLVFIALLIASPIAWYVMQHWLQNFENKISIDWWVFVLAGGLAASIALFTVSFQSIKAALMNPIKSLRTE